MKYHVFVKYKWSGLGSISKSKAFSSTSLHETMRAFEKTKKEVLKEHRNQMYVCHETDTYFKMLKRPDSEICLESISIFIKIGSKTYK